MKKKALIISIKGPKLTIEERSFLSLEFRCAGYKELED